MLLWIRTAPDQRGVCLLLALLQERSKTRVVSTSAAVCLTGDACSAVVMTQTVLHCRMQTEW